MHALVIAAFAVSTAVAQVPEGSTGQTAPPPAPAVSPALARAAYSAADRKAANIAAEGDARWALVGTSTAASLSLYGWILPIALNLGSVSTAAQFAGVYLLTGAAGFFVPFGLTLNSPISWGEANLFFAGAFNGAWHAQLFLTMVKYVEDINNFNLQPRAAVTVAFGVAEAAGGLLWAGLTGMTAGEAHSIIVGSNIGSGIGVSIGTIFVASSSTFDWLSLQVPCALALAGTAGGAVAGAFVGPWLHLTWGDAELLQLSAALGAYVTVPFVSWAGGDSRAYSGLGILGTAGGLVGGYYVLQAMEGSHLALGQAVLIDLGTLAGALVGAGVALVLGGFNDARIGLTSTMVGAVGGYAVSYVAMRGQAQQGMKKAGANMQMMLNPGALAELAMPRAAANALRPSQPPPPVVSFLGSF